MKLLVSIDGLRPDAIALAKTPNLDRLMAEGSFSMSAQTVMPCCTLPCHTSMLRGVDVPRHGINTNTFHPIVRPVPSILDLADSNGLKVGFFYNWGPLRDLHDPESVLISYFSKTALGKAGDIDVTDALIQSTGKHNLDFCFLYLGHVDEAGHAKGWMSPFYLEALENADACVGRVLQECSPSNVFVLSDHGGHERTHGTLAPEDMTITWMVWGESIRSGHQTQSPIVIYDTAPTLAKMLGIAPAKEWDGVPIADVFAG